MPTRAASQPALKQSLLGRSGLKVSSFALGTMTFGAETDEAEAVSQLNTFVDHGGTFIDTADGYSSGESEAIIGRWGKQRGGMEDLVVATKCRFGSNPGASRRSIVRSLENSLQRLQIDCVDLYIIHGWDKDTDVHETLYTLRDLMRAGKIHAFGWSNVSAWQLQKIICTADAMGVSRPVSLQPQYSLLERGIEYEVLPCCLEAGIDVTPWSPLGGGWLSGKYSSNTRPTGATRLGEDPGRGVEAYDVRGTERTFAVLDEVERIAKAHDRTMAHVALAWLGTRPGIKSILLGARTVAQLLDNLAAADLVLGDDELVSLSKASSLGPSVRQAPYPYNFLDEWCRVDIWRRLGTFG